MANESTKVQNPRRNSYAGITPCIEQQVPRTYRLSFTAHARRVPNHDIYATHARVPSVAW